MLYKMHITLARQLEFISKSFESGKPPFHFKKK